jgi:hypothetical protein
VRALLLREDDRRLILTPTLPQDWLSTPGHLSIENAPTRFGPLSFHLEWDASSLNLDLASRTTAPEVVWHLPVPVREEMLHVGPASSPPRDLVLTLGTTTARVSLLEKD